MRPDLRSYLRGLLFATTELLIHSSFATSVPTIRISCPVECPLQMALVGGRYLIKMAHEPGDQP